MDASALLGLHAQLACIWEATARKLGNVHRYRDFDDLTYLDLLEAAAAIAPIMAAAPQHSVGETIYEAIWASRIVRTNANLGSVLLLAPLAKAAGSGDLRSTLPKVLDELDVRDAELAYDAILLAKPGGLGRVDEQDVSATPTQTLREVMAAAADRDLVARQYANGFREVLEDGVPAIQAALEETESLEMAIVWGQLRLMAQHPDTLIHRKRGQAEATESSERAGRILAAKWPRTEKSWTYFADFDRWLRAVGRQRNPGTTADLIAAVLFVMLQESRIRFPVSFRFIGWR
jgi:triphosphoribosyl-dephospho-CoA synthase